MNSSILKIVRRVITAWVITLFFVVAAVLLLNVSAWRARVISRITRVEWPVIVRAPAGFRPWVPAGFRVSVFANGLVPPPWLAVSPNGDAFVADSTAGQVIVMSGISVQGSAESRSIFADHLNLPFGMAFHDGDDGEEKD